MSPNGVVEPVYVATDGLRRLCAALEDGAPDKFGLQRFEESLDHRIVVAVSLARHRDQDALAAQLMLVVDRAVLAAAVRVVNEPGGRSPHGNGAAQRRPRWHCKCICGTEKLVLTQSLRLAMQSEFGGSRSCGCLALERSLTHGNNRNQRPTPEYAAWMGAKKRCRNPSSSSYHRYGGRGIAICDRWRGSFEAFLADMGPKPDLSLSLDRIDPDGDYEPGNCRWAPSDVQARNKTNTRWYEFEGQPALLVDIAAFFGISRDEARNMVARNQLPVRRLKTPPRVRDRLKPLILDLNLVDSKQVFSMSASDD